MKPFGELGLETKTEKGEWDSWLLLNATLS